MRTSTYKSVIDRIAGYMQESDGLSREDAALANVKINFFTRLAWEHYWWPEFMDVEKRRFRPVYSATENIAAGDERYFIPTGTYFQALRAQTPASQAPATLSGGVYLENSAYWAACRSSYSGDDWETGQAYVATDGAPDIVRNLDDDEFYQCIVAHTSAGAFDSTKFGLLTPFVRSIELDGRTSQTFTPATQRMRGSMALGIGVSNGTVNGLALGWIPDLASAYVMAPAGSLNLKANPVSTSLNQDGFSFELDGVTDSASYVLVYELAISAVEATAQRGRVSLANGVSNGSVTGLGLGFTPTAIFLEVMRPAGDLNIKPWPVTGTFSTDGFDFELNGVTDSEDYVLVYEAIVPGSELTPLGISGTVTLGNGVDTGSVTGLGLGFTPGLAQVQVMRPAGGLNLSARSVSTGLSTDGGSVELDGLTDSTSYVLAYRFSLAGSAGAAASAAVTETDLGEIKAIWDRDPQVNNYACRVGGGRGPDFRLRGGEVHVLGTQNQVWVEFRQRPNVYTGAMRTDTATYVEGDERYDVTTGDYWTANQAVSAGESPTSRPDKWDKVEFPYILAEFVAQSAYAMLTNREQEVGPENFTIQMSAGWPLLVAELDKIERQQGQVRQLRVAGR